MAERVSRCLALLVSSTYDKLNAACCLPYMLWERIGIGIDALIKSVLQQRVSKCDALGLALAGLARAGQMQRSSLGLFKMSTALRGYESWEMICACSSAILATGRYTYSSSVCLLSFCLCDCLSFCLFVCLAACLLPHLSSHMTSVAVSTPCTLA